MQTNDPLPIDTLYQGYGKNLYKLTGSESEDEIMNMLNADPGANNSGSVNVPADTIGSGVDTSTTIQTTGSMQAGKKTYDNTAQGYILGVDPKDGLAKLFIGSTTSYLNWNGSTLTIAGSITATSGTIGGFTIGATTLSGGSSLVLSSAGTGTVTGGVLQTASSGERIEIRGDTKRMNFINAAGSTTISIHTGGTFTSALISVTPQDDDRGVMSVTVLAGNTKPTFDIANSGTGQTMRIFQDGTSNAANAVAVTNKGTGAGMSIDTDFSSSPYHGLVITARPDTGTVAFASGVAIFVSSSATNARGIYISNLANFGSAIQITRTGNSASDVTGIQFASLTNAGAASIIALDMLAVAVSKPILGVPQDNTSVATNVAGSTGRITINVGGNIRYIPYFT